MRGLTVKRRRHETLQSFQQRISAQMLSVKLTGGKVVNTVGNGNVCTIRFIPKEDNK